MMDADQGLDADERRLAQMNADTAKNETIF